MSHFGPFSATNNWYLPDPPSCIYWKRIAVPHSHMSDNALLGKPEDNNSKDINKQLNEASSKGENKIIKDTRLSNMLLMCLNYRI